MLKSFVNIAIALLVSQPLFPTTSYGETRVVRVGDAIDYRLRTPFRGFHDAGPPSTDFDRYKPEIQELIAQQRWTHLRELYVDSSCLEKVSENPSFDVIYCSEQKINRDAGYVKNWMNNPTNDKAIQHKVLHQLIKPNFVSDNNRYVSQQIDDNKYIAKIFYNEFDVKDGGCLLPEGKRNLRNGCILADVFLTDEYLQQIGDGARCKWFIAGRQFFDRDCNDPIPSRLSVKLFLNVESEVRVDVTKADGTQESIALAGEDTKIEEVLIVGIGDSYASGEGAPDIPSLPKRDRADPSTAAYWVDLRCHRSALGSQMRSAIQIAAENPRKLTTFLGLACGGAGIIEGVVGHHRNAGEVVGIQRVIEQEISNTRSRRIRENYTRFLDFHTRSQLSQLKHALCVHDLETLIRIGQERKPLHEVRCVGEKPEFVRKEIDFLLLSIGGNDGGFGPVIVHSLLRLPRFVNTVRKFRSKSRPYDQIFLDSFPDLSACKDAQGEPLSNRLTSGSSYYRYVNRLNFPAGPASNHIRKNIPPLYGILDCKLKKELPGIDVKNVIVSMYPNPTKRSEDVYCTGRRGISEFFRFSFISEEESRSIDRVLMPALHGAIKQAVDAKNNRETNWIIADRHNERFLNRGWCVADQDLENLYDSARPEQYNPFQRISSYIHSPKRAIEIQATENNFFSLEPELITRRTAVFHPNNFGHALIADNYAYEVRKILASQ